MSTSGLVAAHLVFVCDEVVSPLHFAALFSCATRLPARCNSPFATDNYDGFDGFGVLDIVSLVAVCNCFFFKFRV